MDKIGEALNHFIAAPQTGTPRPAPMANKDGAPLFTDGDYQEIAGILRTFVKGTALAASMIAFVDRESRVGSKVPAANVRRVAKDVEQLVQMLGMLKPVVERWTKFSAKSQLLDLRIDACIDTVDDNVFALQCEFAALGIE